METSDIKIAAACLREGKLVALPTETVYGLGANALSDDAVAKIFEAKGRPHFNPLIVHMRSLDDAAQYVRINGMAEKIAAAFWPGPLTMVLPRLPGCKLSLLVSAGLDSVAVRVPKHPMAQALLAQAQIPIAAPSANRSGKVSPTQATHVREELGNRVAMILDGGNCEVGIESTVVDVTGDIPVILRPGSITESMLQEIIPQTTSGTSTTYKSPGMLLSHYAPDHPLRLNAKDIREGEVVLAFGSQLPKGSYTVENLSPTSDLREAAANLFAMLRKLDGCASKGIAVMPIPDGGLGVAINDRLQRAANR